MNRRLRNWTDYTKMATYTGIIGIAGLTFMAISQVIAALVRQSNANGVSEQSWGASPAALA